MADLEEIMFEVEEHFEKSLGSLEHDFRRIRTGRASVAMIDHLQVEVYGAMCPITQIANISVPEPQQLLIKPYDKGTAKDIERALIAADLGMSPQNDGEVLRLNVPPLSEERRKQLAGTAKEAAEKCKIGMRNSRRDGIKQIEAAGKEDNWPEDAVKAGEEQVTELLKQYEAKAEAALKVKSDDLLTI